MADENIVNGKKYKVLQDGIWKIFSFFTKASDVEFEDGMNAEEKIQFIEENGVGIELTLAEYESLSEEEKNNGTYWITDANGTSGGDGDFLKPTDVVDSLESTATDLPLSANMGRQLKEEIENIDTVEVVDNLDSTDSNKALSANMGRELKENLDNCFQSVSDGKALVASAITGKGVTTAKDATFDKMATNISNIKTSITPTAGNKNTKTAKLSTYGTTSVTPSIALPANGTYIVTFVACQGSKEGYEVNSSFTVGGFSTSGTNLVENAVVAGYDNTDPSVTGTARLYSQSILVKTGASNVTISRTATAGGYCGNILATIYAIKIG